MKGGGFEWFGKAPAHEALTAYGVLQFLDMAKVAPDLVSPDLISRTTNWLLSRRSASGGGFDQSSQRLDSFGRSPPQLTDVYIIYSLVAAGLDTRTVLRDQVAWVQRVYDDVHITDTISY